MKKITALLILCIFSLSLLVSGGANYQKIYSVDDTIWDDISSLYILTGRSLPSTTGPWSGEELLTMLGRIDTSRLSEYGRELYDSIKAELDSDASLPVFKASLEIDPEFYIQSNTSSPYFQTRDNWVRGWDRQKQLLNINTEEHIGANFYGFFDFSLGVAKDWNSNGDTSPSLR